MDLTQEMANELLWKVYALKTTISTVRMKEYSVANINFAISF